MRSGFTTGTCAAAAARAAALSLAGRDTDVVKFTTPKGISADFEVQRYEQDSHQYFGVKKDAGDDPDVTNGVVIWCCIEQITDGSNARETWYESEDYPYLYLTGGTGIGIVTKAGLSCPVGKYAINPIPRSMIFKSVGEVFEEAGIEDDHLIQIIVPEGTKLAAKTFNPRLGVEGGISILGTTGIVEPMSDQAVIDTIRLDIHMKAVSGMDGIIMTPGNIGERFATDELDLPKEKTVICSNFVADSLEIANEEEIKKVLFVGHLGKLIKTAGGVRNTHSKYGDRRMEILASFLKGDPKAYEMILKSNTTEEAVGHLETLGIKDDIMSLVTDRIYDQLNEWAGEGTSVEVVVISGEYGILGKSTGADDLIREWRMTC